MTLTTKKNLLALGLLTLSLSATTAQAQSTVQELTVKQALLQRYSLRSYSSKALTDAQLLDILWAANGMNEGGKRTAPSAMNTQDIELYVCKADGCYKYLHEDNKLTKVTSEDIRPILKGNNTFVMEAPATILLITNQGKFRAPRDGDYTRNMNFGLMDAGIVSQNISLYTTSVGLGTVCCAPKLDATKIQQVLNLSPQHIPVIYHPVGYAAE